MSELIIEVCADASMSSTDRGALLEKFSRKFLETQGLTVTTQVRITGMEVDLLCKEEATGETILVECKAYRQTISSDVITKLLGNVGLKDYSAGWLISTYALGKDAKGIQEEWSVKPEEKRRRLRIYDPGPLVERLIKARMVVAPSTLVIRNDQVIRSDEAYLLLTKRGEFWAIPLIDPGTRLVASVALFDAETGVPQFDKELVAWLDQTDTTLNRHTWLTDSSTPPVAMEKLEEELQSIVSVPMADHWADYRPSRPIDFVGRENLQKGVFDFFDRVREDRTSTRLLAIKAPSGWGKSSSVLKIADKARNTRNRSKYFVHAVDSRAAISKRFPELALVSAINGAIEAGFVKNVPSLSFGSAGHFFSSDGLKQLCASLSDEKKVICIFFDQFEELLYKESLVDVFDEMRKLCSAVEEAQENIVIGFSWKTDGTITTEHRAYHLWHDLADRRFELELPPFSEQEVSLAIGRFGKELGQPVTQQLRRLLQDHCQGFPWLLKKLCVHILEMSKAGADQNDVLAGNLNIGALFQKDIERLTSREHACIKQIAVESPAEFFKISEVYGDAVTSLMNKRLIIRSGTRLSIYWDIFRDYILTERIPFIPVTYTPGANFSMYIRALDFLKSRSTVSYDELAKAMSLTVGSADNLVRDLVNMGHAEASRRDGILKPNFDTQDAAFDIAFEFWRAHEIVRRLSTDYGYKTTFSQADFAKIFQSIHQRNSFSEPTVKVYSKRTLRWLVSVGLVQHDHGRLLLRNLVRRPFIDYEYAPSPRGRKGVFLASAKPAAVVSAYETLRRGTLDRTEFESRCGRNAVSALVSLDLVTTSKRNVSAIPGKGSAEEMVRTAAASTMTITLVEKLCAENRGITGSQIGERIAEEIGVKWAPASHKRYGEALKGWTYWLLDGR